VLPAEGDRRPPAGPALKWSRNLYRASASIGCPCVAELPAITGHDVLAGLDRAILGVEGDADQEEHRLGRREA
jgi:hypothetical protein